MPELPQQARQLPPRLMLVTDRRRTRGRELVGLIAGAVRGGVGIVQVREKDLPDDEIRDLVQRIRRTLPRPVPILVNGRERSARTLGVGLHLPASAAALRSAGPAPYPWFGRSVHNADEARSAIDEGVSYLVLGTIYPTPSKPGHPGSGVDLVRKIVRIVAPVPLYAIGGVTVSRIPELIHAGAHGIAVCAAILQSNDPARAAEALALGIDVARNVDG